MRKQEHAWCNYSSALFAPVYMCVISSIVCACTYICPTYQGLFIFTEYTWLQLHFGASSSWGRNNVKTGEKWLFQKHQTELRRHKNIFCTARCSWPGFLFFPGAAAIVFAPLPELQLASVIYCCEQFSCHKNEAKCIESNADLQKVCSRRSQTTRAVNIAMRAGKQKQPPAFWCNKAIYNRKGSSSSQQFVWVSDERFHSARTLLFARASSNLFLAIVAR